MRKYAFNSEDRVEFVKVLLALGVMYDREITEELIRVYELTLADMPIRSIKEMSLKHMKASKWFPKANELRCKYTVSMMRLTRSHRKQLAQYDKEEQEAIECRKALPQITHVKSVGQILEGKVSCKE